MFKFTLLLVCFLCLQLAIFAGDEAWHGLYFDQSTIKNAIDLVGKPRSQAKEKLSAMSSVSEKVKDKAEVETLVYEKIDGWEKVALSFLDDKLFRIKFWPHNKSLKAVDIPAKFSADFVSVQGFAKGENLSVFDGQKDPTVPKVYPAIYFMVASKQDRFIIASIKNNSLKAWFPATTTKVFPGSVEDIEILSRNGEIR